MPAKTAPLPAKAGRNSSAASTVRKMGRLKRRRGIRARPRLKVPASGAGMAQRHAAIKSPTLWSTYEVKKARVAMPTK